MKKTLKTFALMLLTAFAFSSCVDVPAPYNLPDKSSNSGNGGGSSSNEGTPVTCAQAAELAKALGDGATSPETYTITGYITEVVGSVSKNQQTFWMADTKGGGRIFEAYYANIPDGITEFKAGTKVKITGKLMKFVNANNGNVIPEMKNANVVILADDGGDGGDTPAGDVINTSCVMAAQIAYSLPDNATSDETYCITGYITNVIGTVSTKTGTPQQSFWMADKMEDGDIFQAYYANVPEGVSEFVIGMKVKITGKLLNYKNANGGGAAEMKNATVVILEEGGGGDTPPVGDVISVTCAEAVQKTLALSDGGTSTETYAVTGYITQVIGDVSTKTGPPQQSFWMADTKDGGQVFQAYWANLPSDVSAFTVGSKVTITGHLKKYVKASDVIPEMQNATVVILEEGDGGQGGDGGDTPGPGGDVLTDLVNGGFEEWVSDEEPVGWKSASSASNATLSKSGDARSGEFACSVLPGTDKTKNVRLASQELTLEAGTYTFSFYAKATTPEVCQTRPGYVPVKADGSVGSYFYPKEGTTNLYFDINNNEWTLVSFEFTLDSKSVVCLVVMNPKETAGKHVSQSILIDDATLVKK